MPFRKALIWIQDQYDENKKQLFLYSGIAFVLAAGLGFLADFLLPWAQWAIFVRAIIALPSAALAFILGYASTLFYVGYKKRTKSGYETWRTKLSPTMRQRASAVIGAVLFVLMFAVAMRPGYTLASSLIVASAVGLFAFMRKTSNELIRERVGLPDARDASLDAHIRTRAKRAVKNLNKKEKEAEDAETQRLEQRLEK